MFNPNNLRVKALGAIFPERIKELDGLFFSKPTAIYVDWSNVIHWQDGIDWHFSLERMKQFFDSFDQVKKVRLYCGTLEGNELSQRQAKNVAEYGYELETKPVKPMALSIDISSIPIDSTAIVRNFIKKSLLRKLDLETVNFLNSKLKSLNQQGILKLEELKCNFDVEMGRDMLRDFLSGEYENFIVWSGDSDFQSPIKQLIADGKSVSIFSISGSVAPEIDATKVLIFDVRKIKEFICWPRELSDSIRSKIVAQLQAIKAKGTPEEAPQL